MVMLMPGIEPHDPGPVKRALSWGSEAWEIHARIAPTVIAMARNPSAAKAKASRARDIVQQRQREEMAVLTASLKKASAG